MLITLHDASIPLPSRRDNTTNGAFFSWKTFDSYGSNGKVEGLQSAGRVKESSFAQGELYPADDGLRLLMAGLMNARSAPTGLHACRSETTGMKQATIT